MPRRPTSTARREPARSNPAQTGHRGRPLLRLRFGFIVIAMVLSVFGARLIQLQGIDPQSYAKMAADEGAVTAVLPARRGDILDRNGRPMAESVAGMMILADPKQTSEHAAELARFLSDEIGVDYFDTLETLRAEGRRYEYVARRIPASTATAVVDKADDKGWTGLWTERDQTRAYPSGDVGANLVGFLGVDGPLAGFESTFDSQLSGKDGRTTYQSEGSHRIPLADSTVEEPVDGKDLRTTLDLDLQFFAQRVVQQTVSQYGADSGTAVVQDTRTGELLALADYPSYDAAHPEESDTEDRGARSLTDKYEPGSVEKALTFASLLDAGVTSQDQRYVVPPQLMRQDRPINDWFSHPEIGLTSTGILAKSSNIGTVLASDKLNKHRLVSYLRDFGLGSPTGVGVPSETEGILTPAAAMTDQQKDRVVFGQSLSVNAVQMTAAINAIANGGRYIQPSLVKGEATTSTGAIVGSDVAETRQVVSPEAAEQTAQMMEYVLDPDQGSAPIAQIPNYRVAGKTGTAQRVGEDGTYDGSTTVSFAGFAPADDPRFTVYVVVQNPRKPGGGSSIAGPAFKRIMSYALRRYGVPPTETKRPKLPVTFTPGQRR